jgi:hypothetical protein
MTSEAIGALVELRVREALFSPVDRHSRRAPRRLILDQLQNSSQQRDPRCRLTLVRETTTFSRWRL